MKDKLPCAVVRDLLPSYIDGLTGEETSALVKAHLDSCPDCRITCDTLRGVPVAEPAQEEKMIDFLQKERASQRRLLMILAVAAVILLLAVGWTVRVYIVGETVDLRDDVTCRVRVNGNKLDGTIILYKKGYGLGRIEMKTDGGTVTIIPNFRESGHDMELHSYAGISYENGDDQKIEKVLLYDRVIWEGGTSITTMTDVVYKTRHAYMGDMSANRKTAEALRIDARFGPFTNRLESADTPYIWTLCLSEPLEDRENAEKDMFARACVLLAMIENLDVVCWEYSDASDGEARSVKVTTADADAFFGENIKACYESLPKLQKLMDKAMLW